MSKQRRGRPVDSLDAASDGRSLALKLLLGVSEHGLNLDAQLASLAQAVEGGALEARELALARELASGVLRYERALRAVLRPMMKRPFKGKDRDLELLAMLGLYQLQATRVPAHAAVNQTVEICNRLAKPWARSVLNALLRRALREQSEGDRPPTCAPSDAARKRTHGRGDSPAVVHSHPDWMYTAFASDWGDAEAQALMAANNERAPMWLRVNALKLGRSDYVKRLESAGIDYALPPFDEIDCGLQLSEPLAVARLPGFAEGQVSVQDGAAQLAAPLLCLRPKLRVADACAAPGGKTLHILQAEPGLSELVSVEIDPARAALLDSAAARLGSEHRATVADFSNLEQWWNGIAFDRVLLDAPCSATGVIRRHPDIKSLRRAADLEGLVERQAALLDAAWEVLRPEGIVLYVTCSVLRRENDLQVQAFLGRHGDAQVIPIESSWGKMAKPGRQILPGDHSMDGFYFARLRKLSRSLRAAR